MPDGLVAVTVPLTVESVTDSAAPAATVTRPFWVALTRQVRPLVTVSSVALVPVIVLETFAAYRDQFVAETVVEAARKHGFTNVTALTPWQEADAGGVTITATPAKHGVYKVTFVLRSGTDAVYFAGDTMLIPELGQIPQRLGHISLALLSTNGLHIRPANNMQVVMNAQEAAELTAILKPELAIPHHYAFTKGFLGDRLITSSDKNPKRYQDASRDVAPETSVRIVEPGTRVEL
jgi:L-ascorbate metabolism protein UlaG (beta-lactamase superfamily)